MLKSMTGFGRGEDTVNGQYIVFEIKSVNHKFFEQNTRITRGYQFLEDRLKGYLQERFSRGKIDVFLQIENMEESGITVEVNLALAEEYFQALSQMQKEFDLPDKPTLALLSRYPDVFTVHKSPEDEEIVWQAVLQVVGPTVDSLIQMRETEGARLRADIMEKAGNARVLVDKIEELAPDAVREYRERLQAKIQELLGDAHLDEQRILTEVAVFADKTAIDEEIVRLRSHFAQLDRLVNASQPVGRKIDFLVQEMNREANTIGSKSQNPAIAYLVVDLKSEIEKIREKVQNVE